MLKFVTPFSLKKLVFQLSFVMLLGIFFNSIANAFPYYRSIHTPGQLALPSANSVYYGNQTSWSQSFAATGGTGYYTYSLPAAPIGATVNAAGLVSYAAGALGEYSFTVRVTDTQGIMSEVSFTLRTYEDNTCVWTGVTSTAWATASNWQNCLGLAPGAARGIAIRTDGAYLPTLSASTSVSFVGLAPALAGSSGGTVTINAGFTLTISRTTNTVRSDIIFQGNTTTCSTCSVTGGANFIVSDFAKLTLLKGITFSGAVLSVGDATTAGQLFTGAAGTQSEWVRFAATTRFVIQGSATQRSILYFDGIVKTGISSSLSGDFQFNANFDVQKFDNITLGSNAATIPTSSSYFNFSSCANSVITDTSWTQVKLDSPTITLFSNNLIMTAANCSTMTAFSLVHATGTTGGWGYGAPFENDTYGIVTWVNGDAHICTWTGATDANWETPSNWSNCINGRLDIPDHLDGALIPVTATQPVVSSSTNAVKNFEPGTGGGTVTINAGQILSIIQPTLSFQSDVKFQGNTTTCTTCYLRGITNLSITDNAKVTLLEGVDFGANSILYVGNASGTTSGQLFTNATGANTTWPSLGNATQTVVNGTAGQKSVINFNGLKHTALNGSTTGEFNFNDHYDIQKFDNIIIGNSGTSIANTETGILFTNCTNALITDASWTGFSFPSPVAVGGSNVQANGTNCNTLTTITISSNAADAIADLGYGEAFDSDTNDKIFWNDGENLTCTWTGATSTAWREPTNWTCPNNRNNWPDRYDSVVIPAVGFSPTISVSETIMEITTGTGGGTLTVNAGTWLVLTSSIIKSDIRFKGDTPTCTTCYVTGANLGNFYITNNAKVTLLSGIDLYANGGGTLYVGNGGTGGKLYTGTETGTSRPSIGVGAQTRLYVNGGTSAPERSEISFDGLRYPTLSTIAGGKFFFNDWYDIKKFDNVTIGSGGTMTSNNQGIVLSICTNAVITDTGWSGFKFANSVTGSGKNIQASGTNCSTLPTITVSSTAADAIADLGYGPVYENDPNSKIDWLDGMQLNCVWTGATSSVWEDATNWNCPNNRNNWPDRYDSIRIPAVGFSPTLSNTANSTFREVAVGAGGGILTINAGVTLTLSTNYIKSDIQFRGDTSTCTTCRVTAAASQILWITELAKVTLLSGIDIYSNGGTYLVLGNGTTGGKLYTGTETGANRPSVGRTANTSIYVWGASALQRSELSLDGLQYPTLSTSLSQKFFFADWYDIVKFDNVTIGNSGSTLSTGHTGVYFNNCTNAVVTDTNWTGFSFPSPIAGTGKNIYASGTGCATLPTITVSSTPALASTDAGYGHMYENDINNKIDWYDGSATICTWTGSTSSVWADATNWTCPNNRYNYPDRYDSVIVPAVGTLPTLTASQNITEIAAGTGGGILTINAGVTLTLTSSAIKSDIQFAGNTSTCTTCRVTGSGNLSITNNAKVTLLSGIDIYSIGGTLNVGNGTTGGKLYTGTQTGNNRPSIGVTSATVVSINGASGQPSEISFDGLQYPTVSAAASSKFSFSNYYDIKKFDNVTIGPNGTAIASGLAGIKLTTCTNAIITDTTWTGFRFPRTISTGGYNIQANDASCAGLADITVSSTPADAIADSGYGQQYELDHANNNIIWSDGMNTTCTWTGSANTAWDNSANWNCPNNRYNYPDRFDSIIVPAVGFAPTLSANASHVGIAAGTGGGTLTVNNGATLTLTSGSIRSDIKFAGNTSTCTTCRVTGSGNLSITDNAKVTLLSGIDIYAPGAPGYLNVGNGATGGKLYTGTETGNNRPNIGLANATNVYVNGGTSAAQRSEVSFNGLKHTVVTVGNASGEIIFNNWFDIKQFDNVTIGQFATALTAANVLVKINNCNANTIFTDTNWQAPEFASNPNATAAKSIANSSTCTKIYMKSATGAMSCATVPGSTACTYESDPGSTIDWDP